MSDTAGNTEILEADLIINTEMMNEIISSKLTVGYEWTPPLEAWSSSDGIPTNNSWRKQPKTCSYLYVVDFREY